MEEVIRIGRYNGENCKVDNEEEEKESKGIDKGYRSWIEDHYTKTIQGETKILIPKI